MKEAESKIFIALEGSGNIPNPSLDLSEALLIDTYAQRYGWEFVKDLLGIEEIDIELFASLQGIVNGEIKKSKFDNLRGKAGLR